MNLTDIIGPVMVGPSSSHTAGAVKIGNIGRKLLGSDLKRADLYFHGSFRTTGKGHGTDRALVAGLLGWNVDDEKIPESLEFAKKSGIEINMYPIDLGDEYHPNSVKMVLYGENKKSLEVIGSSVGGGQIMIVEIDGLPVNFSGDYPTLVVHNQDKPGHVAEVTSLLSREKINIATILLNRSGRGGYAVMVLELDCELPKEILEQLEKIDGVIKVTYLSLAEE